MNPRKSLFKMSNNIPFEIQMEIIKKVSDIKSLIQFRSVSKSWKSFIDSPEFIKGYGARHTQPHSLILRYKSDLPDVAQHFCFVDDDSETLNVQQQEFAPSLVVSPLLKGHLFHVVGACHGLLCLHGYHRNYLKDMIAIWNPSIGKSFGIDVSKYRPDTWFNTAYGFGVCPVTSDPTVVKILQPINQPWQVELFTLSSGVWNVLPSSNLPHVSIAFMSSQVVIDRFIYWGADDTTFYEEDYITTYNMVVSFDLITKEFKVIDLPNSLTNEFSNSYNNMSSNVSVSKLRGSLVVSGYISADQAVGVWVMEHNSSFTKLFSFGTEFSKILGFRKNGETIFEPRMEEEDEEDELWTLDVYDPHSQQIKNLEINGSVASSFFMDSYKQSLLLLDHSDSHIYSDDN